MAKHNKNVKGNLNQVYKKQIPDQDNSTDKKKLVWDLNSIDKNGKFSFDTSRDDFSCDKVLNFMLSAGNRTWFEIKTETHGKKNKSKNHFLDYESLSSEAKDRIRVLDLNDKTDSIFSLRIENLIRIIGIREGEKFVVKWYDPKHEFYPVGK